MAFSCIPPLTVAVVGSSGQAVGPAQVGLGPQPPRVWKHILCTANFCSHPGALNHRP